MILFQDQRAASRPDRYPGRCARGQVPRHHLQGGRGGERSDKEAGERREGTAEAALQRKDAQHQCPDAFAGIEEILPCLLLIRKTPRNGRDQARLQRQGLQPDFQCRPDLRRPGRRGLDPSRPRLRGHPVPDDG